MGVHPWAGSAPEITAMLFEGGPGPAPTLESAAAWAVEAAIHDLSMGLSAMNIASLIPSFVGVGGTASADTGALLNALVGVLGGHCLKQQLIMLAAAELYTAARAGLIPSTIIDANRVETATDIGINPSVLGALTGRIGELNVEYGEYWGQNASVGTAYGAGLTGLTAQLMVPPPVAGMGANPAAPALLASSVAENAATNTATTAAQASSKVATTGMQGAGGGMEQMLSSVTGAMGSAVQPITGMFQSVPQMFQGLASLPQSLMGAFGGMFGGMNGGGDALSGRIQAVDAIKPMAGGGPAGAGFGGGGGGGGAVGGGGAPGLSSFTRPTSSFEPEGGRATSLKQGLLNPAEVRTGPVASGMGGGGMPMSPGGMLGRGQGDDEKKDVQHARVVVAGDHREDR